MATVAGTTEGRYKPSLKAFSKPLAADWTLLWSAAFDFNVFEVGQH
jgi:hypothetical protein